MPPPVKAFREEARDIPVSDEVDVVVCGGGPAGVGAAVAAARRGARVLLTEYHICLGGQATSGMMNRLGPYHDQKNMILGGIPLEIVTKLVGMNAAVRPRPCPLTDPVNYWVPFDPEAMKVLLDDVMAEAGADVLFNTLVAGVIVEDGVMKGVIVENKAGRRAILARIVIDATGDAEVAVRAGVPCGKGREEDGLMQPMGLLSKVKNLDLAVASSYVAAHGAELTAALKQALAANEPVPAWFDCGTDNLLRADETYFNASHVKCRDGTNPRDITYAIITGRRHIWRNLQFMKRRVPGWENAYLSATAAQLGVRETRWVHGDYVLTLDDVLGARQFPDQIARYACWVDTHNVDPNKPNPNEGKALEPGTSYGIPYRCLLPETIENLLIAGRCFSGTHEARASARMIPCCMAMGEAVGVAASACVKTGVRPRDLDAAWLRDQLKSQNVIL
jgi:ribulose 1,5-bisphosphate synthetase/thiazole synthase